jgi:hypothetical protein
MKNSNLHKAKKEKNNEFYTQLSDIEKELGHYKDHFKDKIVFCNCDDPSESNFWNYFALNFEYLGLKKLVSTHFEFDKPSYKLELQADINGDGKVNKLDTIKTDLKQNGDFRSDESIEILKECDIVVTNPPFSIFRDFISLMVEYDKKFLVLGNNNAITYKDVFKHIKENNLWLGVNNNKTMEFRLSDDYEKWNRIDKEGNKYGKVPAISWFTNLEHNKRNEKLILYKEYNENDYPKYDNYEAINVDKVKDIPIDYKGVMGVPITFLDKYNSEQFEILGCNRGVNQDINGIYGKSSYINGKETFKRLFIKNKEL